MLNILYAFLLSTCISLVPQSYPEHLAETSQTENELWITVYIHGTLGLQYTLGPYTMLKIMLDNLRRTPYKNTVEMLRENPTFYKSQAMQGPGLHRADTEDAALGARLFTHAYDTMQQKFAPRPCIYYTFGWSGLLSGKERKQAGKALYQELKEVYRYWRQAGYTPRLSILGYSHGGTIAEYLAPFHAQDMEPTFSHVDELILLGTPVQAVHERYAAWPLFRKVYDIYSRGDIFRKLDFISTPDPWPHRRMRNPHKTHNANTIYEIRFSISMPPSCGDTVYYYAKNRYRKPYDPGHIELYFFGWSNTNWLYRDNFPLAPLPASVLVPALLAYEPCFPGDDFVCDIWPPEEKITLRARHTCQWQQYNFPLEPQLSHLQAYARERRPTIDIPLASAYSARKARRVVYDTWEKAYDKCPPRVRHRARKSSFANC